MKIMEEQLLKIILFSTGLNNENNGRIITKDYIV